ncbi:MAG: DUF3108 domain-containing protein [Hyphomicrobiaceae bacterium]
MVPRSIVASRISSVAAPIMFAGLVVPMALTAPPASATEAWPKKVEATYRIAFNGFDIGSFAFRAAVNGSSYTVESEARISALFGAFKWSGNSRSAGALAGLQASPAGYDFNFEGTGKSGAIKLAFARGGVSNISVVPDQPPAPDTVPIKPDQLRRVLDPLSAVLVMSRTSGNNICNKRLPIFDGKQRFDLVFSYVRQQPIAEQRPTGQPGVVTVCRVRYVPIGGHRMTNETRHMSSTSGIEISLRPIPSAGVHVPYQITIPTVAGSATLTSENVRITTRHDEIALSH